MQVTQKHLDDSYTNVKNGSQCAGCVITTATKDLFNVPAQAALTEIVYFRNYQPSIILAFLSEDTSLYLDEFDAWCNSSKDIFDEQMKPTTITLIIPDPNYLRKDICLDESPNLSLFTRFWSSFMTLLNWYPRWLS